MNLDKWNALPEDIQTALKDSVAEFAQTQVSTLRAADEEAVAAAAAGGEITVHDWSEEERAKFRAIAVGEWEAVAERSDNARLVYDTLYSYLTENGLIQQ